MNDVASFELRECINGRWTVPSIALERWLCDPNDGTRLTPMRATAADALERALATAESVHRAGVWSGRSPTERARCLRAIAAKLEPRSERMAKLDAQASGVVLPLTRKFAAIASRAFLAAADQAEQRDLPMRRALAEGWIEQHRLPLGPALVIGPWNAPAAIAAHKVASALAAGCTVVFKPSEVAPQSGQLIVEAAEEGGLPAGVLQIVHGDGAVGDALAADARIAAVSFTGGLAAGRAVAHRSAERIRPAQLELGGNNPLIVLPGANIALAAEGIVAGLTLLGGQWCRALGRVFAHRSLADELFEKSLAMLGQVRVGHSLAENSDMGPMAYEGQLVAIRRAVERLAEGGGTPHTRTPLPGLSGWFVSPALVTGVDPHDATHEIFGPVATWHSFDEIGDAIAWSRAGDYGLAAYVYGPENDAAAVARRLHAGSIKINEVSVFALDPMAPRPAWGLSGLGEEGVAETFEFFRGSRVVACPRVIP